jgi:hypothetical protein
VNGYDHGSPLQKGYPEGDVRKILVENVLRVMAAWSG